MSYNVASQRSCIACGTGAGNARRLKQLLRRLLFALRIDDFCAAGPFRLSLTGDRADHALV
jgi:hypothetical protein